MDLYIGNLKFCIWIFVSKLFWTSRTVKSPSGKEFYTIYIKQMSYYVDLLMLPLYKKKIVEKYRRRGNFK